VGLLGLSVSVGWGAQADLKKAVEITTDAKTQYPSACNSVETLLVHQVNCDATVSSDSQAGSPKPTSLLPAD
jgi:glutamate-5-semialdehyde dehydrogenase